MATKRKSTKKHDKGMRLGQLAANIAGTVLSKKGLEKLSGMNFMQKSADKPDAKNWKPIAASGAIAAGSGFGAVFVGNEYAAQFMMGMSGGSVLAGIENFQGISGIGKASSADVQRFLDLYKDMDKGVKGTSTELKLA